MTCQHVRQWFERRFPLSALLMLQLLARIWKGAQGLWPGRRAWSGAGGGLALVTAIIVGVSILHGALLPTPTLYRVLRVAEQVGVALAAAIGALVAAALLHRLPLRYRVSLVACGAILAGLFGRLGERGPLAVVFVLIAASLAGAGVRITSGGGMRDLKGARRVVAVGGLTLGLGALTWAFGWVAVDGMEPVEMRNAAAEADTSVLTLDLPNPAAVGPYQVRTLTYGTGDDKRRTEYGADATLHTNPVDGAKLLEDWKGRKGRARAEFWGFDKKALPLQGRVWYPRGEGPFPLVLIVHGNHRMEEFSDPGYAYLGEHLASRGTILVSVDENFINGDLRNENDARAWLLLEHLRQWKQFNNDPSSPFDGNVDMARIGLIGHSRGGEAVAVAAVFNRLSRYPDDAMVQFDYGFDIGAVIAIAPVYGQYEPGGKLTQLRNVNYMSIHGAHDGDVTSFDGARQFENVEFSGDDYRFKATVYVAGANHGQFNSVWGDNDWGQPFGRLLNRRALIAGDDQRQIATVFITAFLDAALGGRTDYLPLFADSRHGADWLPDTIYLTDFADSRSRPVATFDEDIDVTTATVSGGTTRGEFLAVWREQPLKLKRRNKETSAVYLGWMEPQPAKGKAPSAAPDATKTPRYVIELPADFSAADATELYFSLADANEDPHQADKDEEDDGDKNSMTENTENAQQVAAEPRAAEDSESSDDEPEAGEDADRPREPIDFTVRLVDTAGNRAALPLSRVAAVQPQLQVQLRKGVFEAAEKVSEPIPQRFALPFGWFVDINPEFDPTRLRAIEFVFDLTDEAVVILDNVGLR